MADGNYVRISVQASDQAAVADLDDLKGRLDELGAKVDTARADVDDDDAKLKLDQLNARLLTLGERVSRPRVSVAGVARAEAELEGLNLQLDDIKKNEDEAGGGGVLGSLSEGVSGLMEHIPIVGGMLSSLAGTGPGGAAAAIGVLATAFGAAVTEAAGLLAGLSAAGAGAVAFGALAYPAFESVKNAMGDTAAQLKKLSPDERDAVLGIRELKSEYEKMAAAFQPVVFKVFNDGLKVANNLLPTLKAPATDFGNALDGLLKQLGKFTESKGFKEWLGQFDKLIGPATTAIGQGLGKVGGALGKLLTVMSAHDVVHALNIAFDALKDTINAITGIVRFFMIVWDHVSQAFKDAEHDVASFSRRAQTDLANWAQDVDNFVSHAARDIENWAKDFAQYFYTDPHNFLVRAQTDLANWAQDVDNAVSAAVRWFEGLPGKVASALSSLPGMLYSAGQHAVQRLIDGLGSMLGSLGSMAGRLASKVAGFFGLSPAVEGPLSGGGAPEIRGQHFAADFARGLSSGVSQVGSAASRLAGTAGGAGLGGGTAGGATIQLEFTGSGGTGLEAQFWSWLRNGVRIKGGGGPNSVQRALGQTS